MVDAKRPPKPFEQGSPLWTIAAAAAGIVLMLAITQVLAWSGATDDATFINTLAFWSIFFAGCGAILRAAVHNREGASDKRTDHAGKLLTVMAFSAGLTGAAARLDDVAGLTIALGLAILALVVGVVVHVRTR